jgi:hypothetical protein
MSDEAERVTLVCKRGDCGSELVEVSGEPHYEYLDVYGTGPKPRRQVVDYRCRVCDYVSTHQGSWG